MDLVMRCIDPHTCKRIDKCAAVRVHGAFHSFSRSILVCFFPSLPPTLRPSGLRTRRASATTTPHTKSWSVLWTAAFTSMTSVLPPSYLYVLRACSAWFCLLNLCLQTINGHVGNVLALSLSPDSKYIASFASDKLLKIWLVNVCVHSCGSNDIMKALFRLSSCSPDSLRCLAARRATSRHSRCPR